MNQFLMKADFKHRLSPITLLFILTLTGLTGLLTFVEFTDRGVGVEWISFMLMIFGIPTASMVAGYLSKAGAASRCSLELYDDALCGNLVSAASGKIRKFRIPLDQISSVNVRRENMLVIRTRSGEKYKVKDITNAQEFAGAVMMQANQYSNMLQAASQPLLQAQPQQAQLLYTENEMMEASRMGVQAGIAAAEQNAVQRLQMLDKLRTDGLITQEDYDKKKSEFLAQI